MVGIEKMNSDNYVLDIRIDIEEEVYDFLSYEKEEYEEEEIDFTPEEIDEIVKVAKNYILDNDSFWEIFTNCVDSAVSYVKNRRNKTK